MKLYHYHEATMAEMLEAMTIGLVCDPDPQTLRGDSIQHHNVVAQADSCVFDYDLQNSWVTRSRWTVLVNQYINQAAYDNFLDSIEDRLSQPRASGVAFMRSQTVQVRNLNTNGKVARRWGSCMLGWSFRRTPEPQITMHSRSTYLGFLAPLDLMVAARIAKDVGERIGLDPSEIKFTWHLEQAQFHSFRSMAWWYTTPEHKELLKEVLRDKGENYPIYKHISRTLAWYARDDREGVMYGDMAFAQRRRFRMLWHLRTKKPEYYQKFLGEGVYMTQNAMPRIKECWIGSLPFKSKHTDVNPDTEGDWATENDLDADF